MEKELGQPEDGIRVQEAKGTEQGDSEDNVRRDAALAVGAARSAGILMPVSSLPGRHGIGDFGSVSYEFVDMAAQAGFAVWQILPLNPLGYGNSPYQPYSSYAGDEIYISLDRLQQDGLIGSVPAFEKFTTCVDYQAVREFKGKYLKKAFEKFEPDEAYEAFAAQGWVREYAIFLTFKKHNGLACWNEWPKAQKDYGRDPSLDLTEYEEEIRYEIFVQYTFFRQWMTLKAYANKRGLRVMGDVPFYVGIDSQDVWANRECFLLGRDGRPRWIAGVPPDYFSETGQRWGNPIYNWSQLKKTGYQFWIDRLSYTEKLFDIIRIDHFRAFDTYWKIPASCPTAVEGKWIKAPGYEVFDALFAERPDMRIIVEDLGDLFPGVHKLRDHYGFAGMKVLQFTFDPLEHNNDFEDRENMIMYTGTHDNQTVTGWYRSQPQKFRRATLRQLREEGYADGRIHEKFIRNAMDSIASVVVVPVWDFLGLDDSARMNTPGTVGSPNWEWRLKSFTEFRKRLPQISEWICESGREAERG